MRRRQRRRWRCRRLQNIDSRVKKNIQNSVVARSEISIIPQAMKFSTCLHKASLLFKANKISHEIHHTFVGWLNELNQTFLPFVMVGNKLFNLYLKFNSKYGVYITVVYKTNGHICLHMLCIFTNCFRFSLGRCARSSVYKQLWIIIIIIACWFGP